MTSSNPRRSPISVLFATVLLASLALPLDAQVSSDPFPDPIQGSQPAIQVGFSEFATIPDIGGAPARMMLLVDEPGSGYLFVNAMQGPLFRVSYDGQEVQAYVDINDPQWGVSVQARGSERGFQSFAFHPQFGQSGTPGYGKFYTWTDTQNQDPQPDFAPREGDSHDTVLLEWTAATPGAPAYDGAAPREMMRFQQPFSNHNAGHLAFNSSVSAGDPDFGMLYVGVADGGSGGDPQNLSQDLASAFGKILRIDPLGTNSSNGGYGIPADNPFVADGDPSTLGEIWVLGVRNPQRFGWDAANGAMYMADIGQNTVEELSPITRGANLGWNVWEGSFRYEGRAGVGTGSTRSDPAMTYPIAEYAQADPLLQNQSAATGVHVYRSNEISQLSGLILFGDNPSGEIFAVSADDPPSGGQSAIRRVLLGADGQTLMDLIHTADAARGRSPANRADLRFGSGANGRVYILNKRDGIVRLLVPGTNQ